MEAKEEEREVKRDVRRHMAKGFTEQGEKKDMEKL